VQRLDENETDLKKILEKLNDVISWINKTERYLINELNCLKAENNFLKNKPTDIYE